MAADKVTSAIRQSVLLIALSKYGEKSSNRDHLKEGSSTPIAAEVAGIVGRASVKIEMQGILQVGTASVVNSSSAAPPADVLAAVLAEIPADRRVKLLDKLQKQFVANEGALTVDESLRAEAKTWLSTLKMARPTNRAGSVSFLVQQ
jgi:hypothetical protein